MRTVYDYFGRACARGRALASTGPVVRAPDGTQASFRVESDGERVSFIQYRCTTCVTLVALSEHLSELLTGVTMTEARAYTAERLLSFHPEIPAERRDRADLAIAALHAALD